MKQPQRRAIASAHGPKLAHLKSLSEAEFRDKVVRPLFLYQGMKYYKDNCGPDEQGKDAIFWEQGLFGAHDVIVVQTKKGDLKLTASSESNLENIITQLRTAANTKVALPAINVHARPNKVYLCTSGIVSNEGKKHILDELPNSSITILDADDLVPLIDAHFPEYWSGVNPRQFPYLRAFSAHLLHQSDTVLVRDVTGENASAPITDEAYVGQKVFKFIQTVKQAEIISDLKEIDDKSLLSLPKSLILVTGDGGSGKSTMLRRLAYLLCERGVNFEGGTHPHIPVILRATATCHADRPLIDSVHEAMLRIVGGTELSIEDTDLESGRVVVMIDALDEIKIDEKRNKLLERILDFRGTYPKCSVIITSRDVHNIGEFAATHGMEHYRVSEFSIKQASNIVDRLAKGKEVEIGSNTSKEILRQLESVHGMKLSPLLVTAFAASASIAAKDIPPNITEIFKKFTALMLGQWDESKGLHQQYEWNVKAFVLSHVALHMQQKPTLHLPYGEFDKVVQQILDERGKGDKKDVMVEEIMRSGLVLNNEGFITFRHPMLQEFFAGRAVESADFFVPYLHDENWRNTIIFYFGENPTRAAELLDLAKDGQATSDLEAYNSAITVGLTLQACYLGKQADRMKALEWTISTMSRGFDGYLKNDNAKEKFPIHDFAYRFLTGKDSVATDLIKDRICSDNRIYDGKAPLEMQQFWEIVGLLEIGEIQRAEAIIQKFQPEEPRLLLALSIICHYILNVKVASSSDKRQAEKIIREIMPRIEKLSQEFLKEFRTFNLELRKGKLSILSDSNEEQADAVNAQPTEAEQPKKKKDDLLKKNFGIKRGGGRKPKNDWFKRK